MEAKKALWKVCEKQIDIIGPMVNCRVADKKKATIDDIGKAMLKLKEQGTLPLLLGSSDMMKRAPCYNTSPDTATSSDVLARVKVLEDVLGSYMKIQTDEFKKLSHAVGLLVPPAAPVGRPRRVSVASKKHKLDEDSEEVFIDAVHNPAWKTSNGANQNFC